MMEAWKQCKWLCVGQHGWLLKTTGAVKMRKRAHYLNYKIKKIWWREIEIWQVGKKCQEKETPKWRRWWVRERTRKREDDDRRTKDDIEESLPSLTDHFHLFSFFSFLLWAAMCVQPPCATAERALGRDCGLIHWVRLYWIASAEVRLDNQAIEIITLLIPCYHFYNSLHILQVRKITQTNYSNDSLCLFKAHRG